jgi:hypothetical protein
MSQDSIQISHHSGNKCAHCGLVNAAADEHCRRCGSPLIDNQRPTAVKAEPLAEPKIEKRSFLKRAIWTVGVTLVLLAIWYVSLLISSDGLRPEQQEQVQKSIGLLQQRGFSREAFVLKHLTAFRSTDNWLNSYAGHRDAYAATNFPFEIVTLYPEFFEVPVDDRERAAVLLHEARHLLGDGEDAALQATWHGKQELGWTADKYNQTRVWDATQRLTRARFPYFFQCGPDGQSDCLNVGRQ